MRTRTTLIVVIAALVSVALVGCTSLPKTRLDAGRSLQEDEQYAEAIAEYQQFITENEYPSLNGYAQYRIGICYEEMGDTAAAAAAYKKTIEQYPASEAAMWAEANLRELEAAE